MRSPYRRKRADDPPEVIPRRAAGFQTLLTSTVVVLFAAFTLVGLNGRVNELSERVSLLRVDVQQLQEVEVQIDELNRVLADTRKEVEELSNARTEIITAICEVLELPPARCGL